MRMPSSAQKKLLVKAAENYQGSIMLANSYLRERKLWELAGPWGLGVVESPEPGHEGFRNRLCIPYMNRAGVMALRFRCLDEHDCKDTGCSKYMWTVGSEIFLFNVVALDTTSDIIHVTEGELDAITLSHILSQPVIGVPGAGQFKPHWSSHFRGFDRVLLWPDGDKAGKDMANRWRKEIQAVEAVTMPTGYDVNRLYCEEGPEIFRKLAGVEE